MELLRAHARDGERGLYLDVELRDGTRVRYMHLLRTMGLEVGTDVRQGQVIALAGHSGRTPHDRLRLELWQEVEGEATTVDPMRLLAKGTPFQIQVWRALMRIPDGRAVSYGDLAAELGRPGGARAVGSACGANRIGVLIPCHRVLRETGALGGYRWGLERKQALLAWESARQQAAPLALAG